LSASAPLAEQTKEPGQKLGFFMCVALIMGNMIGSGVFLLPASLAPFGWNAVAGWVLTIGGALALAFVLAQLTKALPNAGGPTGFVAKAFGPVPSFLIGWVYWVSIWLAVVTIAVAAVSYLSSFLPVIGTTPLLPAVLAVGLLWLVTIINLRGVRAAGGFQLITVLLKLMPLIVVIVIAALLLAQGRANLAPFPAEGLKLSAINASVALTLWALLGFESASMAVAKADNPEVTVPRATMVGTALTGILYLFVCSAIALMLPQDVASASPAPFATFVERTWGGGPAELIALFAAISCIGALNGWVLMQGELPRSMAVQGLLPQWLARTNADGTPVRAILLSSTIASVFVLINASKSMKALFEFLLLLSTSTTLWLYLAVALAALKLRVAMPVAVVGAVYSVWTLWGAGVEASVLSFVLMAAGLPLYYWVRRGAAIDPQSPVLR
jgi:APA family basic amino acid/polyamine antiporter